MLVCFYASQCISFKKEIMIDVFLRNRYTSWFHSVDPVSMRQWSAVTVVWNAHWEGNQAVVQRRRLGPLHHQGAIKPQETIGSANSQFPLWGNRTVPEWLFGMWTVGNCAKRSWSRRKTGLKIAVVWGQAASIIIIIIIIIPIQSISPSLFQAARPIKTQKNIETQTEKHKDRKERIIRQITYHTN